MTDLATNVLYNGDNRDILRRYLPNASVDLVYLDPPFHHPEKDLPRPMTTHRWRGAKLRGVAVLMLALAACVPAPASSASAEPSPLPSVEPVTVTLVDSSFGPDVSVPVGTTVVFVNSGGLKHTASHGVGGQLVENSLFDIVLEPAASDSYTFDTPGTYPITCIVHPLMNMTLTVE